jgi:metal-responsive CopG/Arc/MetJ family transcriptional regulator
MTTVKTAISIDESLFEEANQLAQELKVSRSQVFATALEEYIQRQKNCAMLKALNRVYAQGSDDEDTAEIAGMRPGHRRLVDGEW